MHFKVYGQKSFVRRIDRSLKRYGIRGSIQLFIRKARGLLWRVGLFFAYQGFDRRCPFCHLNFCHFIAYRGEPSPLFAKEHIIGGGPFDDSVCPFCSSFERERHVYLFLKTRTSVFTEQVRMLHLAPERNLQHVLQRCRNIRYVSADLDSALASVPADITALPFTDDSFDVIICNHVLEHIRDDRRAIREVIRVLKPSGWAILQVPIAASRAATVDAPWVFSPRERLRLFGQDNHVRLYGRDYARRLEAAGFLVELHSLPKENGDSYVRHFGLLRDEDIYLARKPSIETPTDAMLITHDGSQPEL